MLSLLLITIAALSDFSGVLLLYSLIVAWIVLAAYREYYCILLFDCAYSKPEYPALKKQWYKYGTLARAVLTVLIGLSVTTGLNALILMGEITFLWWVIFDGTLNYLRGLPFFYVGYEAGPDKFIRRLAAEHGLEPEFVTAIVKGLAFLFLIAVHLIA